MTIQKNIRFKIIAVLIAFTAILSTGCTNDKDIKAQINVMAKTDVTFAGVSYIVKDKVVTLSGNCPSLKAKQEVEKAIKGINLIKGINNHLLIAPVVLDMAFPIKQAVDSVLAQYPTITADVTATATVLKGRAPKQDIDKLLPAINKLNPPGLNNQINVE